MRALLLFLILLPLADANAQEAWWDSSYSYRRAVASITPAQGRTPSDACLVSFTTAGACLPSRDDIRVVSRGDVVPFEVLSVDDEDRVTLVFQVKDPKAPYWIYFGDPSARPAKQEYHPQAGLVLETRELGKGKFDTWEQFRALLESSTTVMGRGPFRTVAMGFNPFGHPNNYLAIFTGWFAVPVDGHYQFATNSWEGSFVVVDGKVVVSWGGAHDPRGANGDHNGAVDLTKGVHKLEYFNISTTRGQGCVCGWKPPGQAQWSEIPDTAFVGGYLAQAGQIEGRLKVAPADFDWSIVSDLGLQDREITQVQFRESVPRGRKAKTISWDFGDGLQGTGSRPRHVYLHNGRTQVKLSMQLDDGQTAEIAQSIRVQPYWAMGDGGWEGRVREYYQATKDYPLYTVSPEADLQLAWLCLQLDHRTEGLKAYEAAFSRTPPINDSRVAEGAFEYGDLLLSGVGESVKAAPHFAYVARVAKDPVWKVRGAVREAEALIERQGDLDGAKKVLEQALVDFKDVRTDFLRWARIRLADVDLFQGNRDKAAAAYKELQYGKDYQTFKGDPGLSKGDHVVSFEEALRQKDIQQALAEIRTLEWEQPMERLTGLPDWMISRMFLNQGRDEEAAIALDRVVRAAPHGTYAAAALLALADIEGKKDPAKARTRWQEIVSSFPETPEAREARRKLGGEK